MAEESAKGPGDGSGAEKRRIARNAPWGSIRQCRRAMWDGCQTSDGEVLAGSPSEEQSPVLVMHVRVEANNLPCCILRFHSTVLQMAEPERIDLDAPLGHSENDRADGPGECIVALLSAEGKADERSSSSRDGQGRLLSTLQSYR
jgi:hypothetical protein